jgi:hypothetical protein
MPWGNCEMLLFRLALMAMRSYIHKCLIWLAAGIVVGVYFPKTPIALHLHRIIRHALMDYSAWGYRAALMVLFLAGFPSAVKFIRRYSNNWRHWPPPFTVVEGSALFFVGAITTRTAPYDR